MRRNLTPNPPRPYLLPIQAILQPASILTPYSIHAKLQNEDNIQHRQQQQKEQRSQYHPTSCSNTKKEPKFQDWNGSSVHDHATNRMARGDITDPEVEGMAHGKDERTANSGIADAAKSSATTERDLGQNSKRARKEYPEAPEPIIGMNDERGRKGH